jgi:hypothetical protein
MNIKSKSVNLNVIAILFLIGLTNSLKAQKSLDGMMRDFYNLKINEGASSQNNLNKTDIEGSPFLGDEFSPGNITTFHGEIYSNIPLRYNAFTDDLVFLKDKDLYNINPKTIVKKAEFDGMVFGYRSYDKDGKTLSAFFEILTEGKATLLIKYSVEFNEKEEVKAYSDAKPARYGPPQKTYYIAFNDTPAKIIINKKSLLELFGAQKNEMDTYISKNKLSIRGDDAMTKIVVHYNSL